MTTEKEIAIANSTARSSGSSVFTKEGDIRSKVAKYVEMNVDRSSRILDYGCGPKFVQGTFLNEKGFNVEGFDFGNNKPANCVVLGEKKYDVIYASNVLNVQSSLSMLCNTIAEIKNNLEVGGMFIANYPESPRKMELLSDTLVGIVEDIFGSKAKRVGGSKRAPVFVIYKK